MKTLHQKYHKIIQELSENLDLRKRDHFLRLEMAQGIVYRYLKHLAAQSWIKLSTAPPKRMLCWLMPKGMAEKMRLTYEFVGRNCNLLHESHRNDSQMLQDFACEHITKREVFHGFEPPANVAGMSLKENGHKLASVRYEDVAGSRFFNRKTIGIDAFECPPSFVFRHSRKDDRIQLKFLAIKSRVANLFE